MTCTTVQGNARAMPEDLRPQDPLPAPPLAFNIAGKKARL